VDYNRLIWIIVFFVGTVLFAVVDKDGMAGSLMGWFIMTSFWSAFCGIFYSLTDWFIGRNKK